MQFRFLKYDIYRYFYPNDDICKLSMYGKIKIILTTQGIWATLVYRFRRWTLFECRNSVLKKLLSPLGSILQLFIEITTGIHIEPKIDIGPGLYIGHFGNIFLGGETKIGKFCNISQENTIGYAGRGVKWGLPIIGDYVYIAPGAKIIGKIVVGNQVAIGANAVVTKDLPDNAVVVGVPARIINYDSSKDFVLFNRDKCRKVL
ncbi:MAG: serine O-acetyltransferase [Desulforhopalus sp.]|jgi:serine O-acetyltransferase